MIMTPQQQTQQQAANNQGPEIIGPADLDLKNATKIDLRTLEPGQGGYTFTWVGAIKLEGQYGPYYIVGVKDQNGGFFKFFSNTQINKMIAEKKEPFNEIGTTFFITCKLKPNMEFQTSNGETKLARGYTYDFQVVK